MTAQLRQLAARRLGRGRWRVELMAVEPWTHGALPSVSEIAMAPLGHNGDPPSLEALSGAHGRWSVVLAGRPEHADASFMLSARDGRFAARIHLADNALEEPSPVGGGRVVEPRAGIDYTARDFNALRAMLLAAVNGPAPASLSENPVSQAVAVIEELAYLGDTLSYQQDAIAAESHLATCRKRISAARHAALLACQVGERISARAWVRIVVAEKMQLPAGTRLLAGVRGTQPTIRAADVPAALAQGAIQFETVDPNTLLPTSSADGDAAVTTTSDATAASATAVDVPEALATVPRRGMLMLIEPAEPSGGFGQVVRITKSEPTDTGAARLHWHPVDALAPHLRSGALKIAVGNIVLVEQRVSHPVFALPDPTPGRYYPHLPLTSTAYAFGSSPYDSDRGAADVLTPHDREPVAAVELTEHVIGSEAGKRRWSSRRSLLESGPGATVFVVEEENDGSAFIRFGDDINGARPRAGTRFNGRQATCSGAGGNVKARSIRHLVCDDRPERVIRVHSAAPAVGGLDPEPLASIQLRAPVAYRVNDRVITEADYVEQAKLLGATDAQAVLIPGGSGAVALVYAWWGTWDDPDPGVFERLRDGLAARQPLGVELDLRPAVPLSAEIVVEVTVEPGYSTELMAQELDNVTRQDLLRIDRFTFGTALHASDLIGLARQAGVVDVVVPVLDWFGSRPPRACESLIPPLGRIIRISDELFSPGLGRLRYQLRAGVL